MPEDNPLDQTKDAVDDNGAAVYADRLKKHVVKHMTNGHPAHIAVALAQQSMAQEDEANEVGESEPDADDKAMTVVQPLGQVVDGQPLDIPAVARSVGTTDDIGAIKRALIAIARRSGLLDQLPHEWFDESLEIAPGGLRKSFDEQLRAGLKTLGLLKDPEPQIGGFKVFTDSSGRDRWFAWYSNNFEDREQEFFSEKGFDRYVKRLDMGLVDMPEYWTWHTKGTRAGIADWVDRIGHFHLATGMYDDTPIAQATKAYDIQHQKEYGVSHGFLYRKADLEVVGGKRVYKDWNTFEISTLPLHRAANELTAFAVEQSEGIKELKMDAEKRKALVDKYAALGGETFVVKLEQETEKRGKDMEELKGYKDFVHPDGDSVTKANKEALENADKAFGELMPQLMEDAGEAVTAALQSVKAVTVQNATIAVLQADNAALHTALKEIRDELALKPRAASSASETALDTSTPAGKALLDKVNKQLVERDDFWGTEVVKS